ncbi:MAG: hypothetical protein P4M15_07300 [Alphaproteobacteria bacterium]|nr:hypothetical protein [Alphaproteobacteria bacterium]
MTDPHALVAEARLTDHKAKLRAMLGSLREMRGDFDHFSKNHLDLAAAYLDHAVEVARPSYAAQVATPSDLA